MNDRSQKRRPVILQPNKIAFSEANLRANPLVNTICYPKNPPNISIQYLGNGRKREELLYKESKGKENNDYQQLLSERERQRNRQQLLNQRKPNPVEHKRLKKDSSHSHASHIPTQITIYHPQESQSTVINKIYAHNMVLNHAGQPSRQSKPNNNRPKKHEEKPKAHKTEWVISVNQDVEGDHLGCTEHLQVIEAPKPNLKASHFKHAFGRKSQNNLQSSAMERKCFRTVEQELQHFEGQVNRIQSQAQNESLAYITEKENRCASKYSDYLQRKQVNIDYRKRAFIIDYMIGFLTGIRGKRETLANAVNLLDRYLTISDPIEVRSLQIIGLTSLFISCKIEDSTVAVKAFDFSVGVSNEISSQEILALEMDMLLRLGFKMSTPTINAWANRICAQWDIYLDSKDTSAVGIIEGNLSNIRFKAFDTVSYINFRTMMQYVDFCLMDIQTLAYKNRTIAASLLYITLVLRLGIYSMNDIMNNFRYSSQYILEKNEFNEFFDMFLKDSFSLLLLDLYPAVQYCVSFVIVDLDYESSQAEDFATYEDYCCLQTYNPNIMHAFVRRNRNLFW